MPDQNDNAPKPDAQDNSGGDEGGFKPIASQDELNRVVADRITRERAKYGDYDDLKAKAARLDQIEAANKSELEKVTERVTAAEERAAKAERSLLARRIADEHELGPQHLKFLNGTTEAELIEQAKDLAALDASRKKHVVPREGTNTNQRPKDDEMREFARGVFQRAE